MDTEKKPVKVSRTRTGVQVKIWHTGNSEYTAEAYLPKDKIKVFAYGTSLDRAEKAMISTLLLRVV